MDQPGYEKHRDGSVWRRHVCDKCGTSVYKKNMDTDAIRLLSPQRTEYEITPTRYDGLTELKIKCNNCGMVNIDVGVIEEITIGDSHTLAKE